MTTTPRVRKPDLQAFYDTYGSAPRVGRGGYTVEQRFRDFRAAFGTDEGKRALAQIIDLCEGPTELPDTDVQSHATLAYRAGMRRIGLEIVFWMNWPKAQLERTES